MATAAREVVPAESRKVDGRRKNGGRRPGAGRPGWQPIPGRREISPGVWREETQEDAWERVRQEVRLYVAIGYPQEVIANQLKPQCSVDTLQRKFAWELQNGKYAQDAKVAGVGYFMATSGRYPDMTRFWLRTRLGWRDTGDVHVPTAPIQFQKIEGDDW